MIIRKPERDELKLIESLTLQAFSEANQSDIKLIEEPIKGVSKELYDNGAEYFIALENGEVLGWIFLGKNVDAIYNQTFGFIYELFVLPEFRNRGIATKLMEFSFEHFKNKDILQVKLNVHKDNTAKKLYDKLGFNEINISMNKTL
ncbi:GNAT family N-acetyltransferase [Staphylococcus auricularis]|uniref:GNAT family N-acetyltransferase n=1 Tax=Staphylococcus auricularis TaxID=29379 RepID=UPI0024307CA7|nr:GNAT family N-acetyltransferase [Staphylococcus auricularis]